MWQGLRPPNLYIYIYLIYIYIGGQGKGEGRGMGRGERGTEGTPEPLNILILFNQATYVFILPPLFLLFFLHF